VATLLIDCPFCHGQLEVNPKSGKVVNKWEPRKKGSGDRFKEALEKMKDDKAKRADFFETAHETMEQKKREADKKFEREKERVKEEKDFSPPPRPFDLD